MGTLKDFMRKAQNVSQLAFAVILATIFPFFLNSAFGVSGGIDPTLRLFIIASVVGYIVALIGGMTFGGIGFLDSKDELWIIQAPPNGASKFVRARIMEALLMILIVATIPAVVLFLFLDYSLADTLVIWIYAYASLFGAAMVGIGVSANNPMYDDTQSGAFKWNRIFTVLIVFMTSYPVWFFVAIILFKPWVYGLPVALAIMIAPLLLAGALTVFLRAKRLSRPTR